jgi:hypothetical protein
MRDPRWRQVLKNARTLPPRSRSTTTEVAAMSSVNQVAGLAQFGFKSGKNPEPVKHGLEVELEQVGIVVERLREGVPLTPLVQQLTDLGVMTHLVSSHAGAAQRKRGLSVQSSQQGYPDSNDLFSNWVDRGSHAIQPGMNGIRLPTTSADAPIE